MKAKVKTGKLKKLFGIRIKILRLMADLTQEELAEKIDVTLNTIGHIERGISGTNFENLVKLSLVFKVEVKDLFNFDSLN